MNCTFFATKKKYLVCSAFYAVSKGYQRLKFSNIYAFEKKQLGKHFSPNSSICIDLMSEKIALCPWANAKILKKQEEGRTLETEEKDENEITFNKLSCITITITQFVYALPLPGYVSPMQDQHYFHISSFKME